MADKITAVARSKPGQQIMDAVVVDTHVHAGDFVPQPFRSLYRLANRRTMPPQLPLSQLAGTVDAVFVKAVGDRLLTRLYGPVDAVGRQLDHIRRQALEAGAVVTGTVGELTDALASGRLAVVLGMEGADAAGEDVDTFAAWHDQGLRVVGLVHLGDNQFGTTSLAWHQYAVELPVRRRRPPGLTDLGARAVRRLQDLGVLVDLAHADRATTLAAVDAARRPVASTHAGARAVQDFPRFLSDEELRAIAGTGGVVGLWPFRYRSNGVADIGELVAHARHIADLVGPEHVCLGTDLNGVPGLMAGYRGPHDLPMVTAALLDGGFADAEVRGILGANALRVLAAASG